MQQDPKDYTGTSSGMNPYLQRMIRAARLDVSLYEEVEADPSAMMQAMGVVVMSSIAAGIGTGSHGIGALIGNALLALLGWFFWSVVMYYVGTRIMPEQGRTQADYGQLLRTIGFASSPGILRILGIIGPLRNLIFVGSVFWMLVATVIAIRQALDYSSTGRALIVCFIGFIIGLFLALLVATPFICAGAAAT